MTAYLQGLGHNIVLDSVDAVMLSDCIKNARICVNKKHRDNYVDKAAYSGIAGECALEETK